MTSSSFHYVTLWSAFGTLIIVWHRNKGRPKVHRLFLPNEETLIENVLRKTFTGISPLTCPAITELGKQIQSFLKGERVNFELNIIALEQCPEFQKKVLTAEHRIPWGWVSTYGRIARSLETPQGARAVGRALAQNPFPIIIPCHRAIRHDGKLGGFRGGLEMKRALLELEGVEFSQTGRVVTDRIYY